MCEIFLCDLNGALLKFNDLLSVASGACVLLLGLAILSNGASSSILMNGRPLERSDANVGRTVTASKTKRLISQVILCTVVAVAAFRNENSAITCGS